MIAWSCHGFAGCRIVAAETWKGRNVEANVVVLSWLRLERKRVQDSSFWDLERVQPRGECLGVECERVQNRVFLNG